MCEIRVLFKGRTVRNKAILNHKVTCKVDDITKTTQHTTTTTTTTTHNNTVQRPRRWDTTKKWAQNDVNEV
jgi:hypothetical protein